MSAETVDQMIGQIIEHEGTEYTDRPGDRGGPTKFGITLATLQAIKYDTLNDGVIDARDVQALTENEAADIYRRQYYLQPHVNTLPPELQPMMFDEIVNNGQKHAIECMQEAIRCPQDGVIGDGTRSVLNDTIKRIGLKAVNNHIVDAFIERYTKIVEEDPSQSVNLHGWENRANSWRM